MTDFPSVTEMQILGRIVDLSEAAGGRPVSHVDVLEALQEGTDLRDLNAHVRSLAESNHVRLDERYGGAWLARPTDAGRAVWTDSEKSRTSPRLRRTQMRDDYLFWLYGQDEAGLSPSPDEFLATGATFRGVPYTQEDLERTGAWLHERGFIKGPGAWQRPDPIRPQITAKGEHYIEKGWSVNDSVGGTGSTTFHTTIHGPAVLAQNSQNVTQTQNVNAWKDDARSFALGVSQLAGISPDVAELGGVAAELRKEIEGEARPGRARELVDTIVKSLGSGAGGALGGALIAQAGALLAGLPN